MLQIKGFRAKVSFGVFKRSICGVSTRICKNSHLSMVQSVQTHSISLLLSTPLSIIDTLEEYLRRKNQLEQSMKKNKIAIICCNVLRNRFDITLEAGKTTLYRSL